MLRYGQINEDFSSTSSESLVSDKYCRNGGQCVFVGKGDNVRPGGGTCEGRVPGFATEN